MLSADDLDLLGPRIDGSTASLVLVRRLLACWVEWWDRLFTRAAMLPLLSLPSISVLSSSGPGTPASSIKASRLRCSALPSVSSLPYHPLFNPFIASFTSSIHNFPFLSAVHTAQSLFSSHPLPPPPLFATLRSPCLAPEENESRTSTSRTSRQTSPNRSRRTRSRSRSRTRASPSPSEHRLAGLKSLRTAKDPRVLQLPTWPTL